MITNAGERWFLSKLEDENLTAHLYVNDYTPVEWSVVGSFTEMSTLGYASKSVSKDSWAIATDGSDNSTATNTLLQWNSFIAGTPVTVYGFYLKTSTDIIVGAKRFTNPPVIGTSGEIGAIEITPSFKGD